MSLPNVISQETFDQAVLENIVEFDRTLPEAIAEAVEEFGAQEVNLGNIIKDLHLGLNNDTIIHPVLESLSQLKLEVNADEVDRSAPISSSDNILEVLTKFSSECKKSLPHRLLAATNGAYKTLLMLIERFKQDAGPLSAAVMAIHCLTEGNPDILDEAGVKSMVELMEQCQQDTNSDVMEALARWCVSSNFKHEANRQSLFSAGVPHSLVQSLANCTPDTHKNRILATLKALKSFTLDDDIRAEFGLAHQNCRHLVEDEGLIEVALGIVQNCLASKSGAVAGEGLAMVSSICVRAEYCQLACEHDALTVISNILENFPESAVLTKQSIALISTLAGDDKVKVMVMKTKAPHLIAAAMDKHQLHVGVCSAACSAVSMLALRHPQHALLFVQCGAAGGVLQAMKQHQKEKQLMKVGCLALRNLSSRSKDVAGALRDLQAEEVVRAAVELHGAALADLAKSALRDMGAEVDLKEVWHGKGHEIGQ